MTYQKLPLDCCTSGCIQLQAIYVLKEPIDALWSIVKDGARGQEWRVGIGDIMYTLAVLQ